MYAFVRRYEGITDAKETARRANEGLVPLISQHPGFVSYYLVDSGGGVFTGISVFLNKADAEESSKRTVEWVRQNVATLVPNPPQVSDGEVVAYKK